MTADWYRCQRLLGTGSFSQVWQASVRGPGPADLLPLPSTIAVKVFRPPAGGVGEAMVESETVIHRPLLHPHVARFFAAHATHRGHAIALEYSAGGSLYTLVRTSRWLEERTLRPLFAQIVSALLYLHQRHIAHRDVKLENALFFEVGKKRVLKLIDFGLAADMRDGVATSAAGARAVPSSRAHARTTTLAAGAGRGTGGGAPAPPRSHDDADAPAPHAPRLQHHHTPSLDELDGTGHDGGEGGGASGHRHVRAKSLPPQGERLLSLVCGSLMYTCPEILEGRPYLGRPVDIWSTGVLLYACAVGSFPFHGRTEEEIKRRISGGRLVFPSHASAELRDLCGKMMAREPSQRLTIEQVAAHPWLQTAECQAMFTPAYLSSVEDEVARGAPRTLAGGVAGGPPCRPVAWPVAPSSPPSTPATATASSPLSSSSAPSPARAPAATVPHDASQTGPPSPPEASAGEHVPPPLPTHTSHHTSLPEWLASRLSPHELEYLARAGTVAPPPSSASDMPLTHVPPPIADAVARAPDLVCNGGTEHAEWGTGQGTVGADDAMRMTPTGEEEDVAGGSRRGDAPPAGTTVRTDRERVKKLERLHQAAAVAAVQWQRLNQARGVGSDGGGTMVTRAAPPPTVNGLLPPPPPMAQLMPASAGHRRDPLAPYAQARGRSPGPSALHGAHRGLAPSTPATRTAGPTTPRSTSTTSSGKRGVTPTSTGVRARPPSASSSTRGTPVHAVAGAPRLAAPPPLPLARSTTPVTPGKGLPHGVVKPVPRAASATPGATTPLASPPARHGTSAAGGPRSSSATGRTTTLRGDAESVTSRTTNTTVTAARGARGAVASTPTIGNSRTLRAGTPGHGVPPPSAPPGLIHARQRSAERTPYVARVAGRDAGVVTTPGARGAAPHVLPVTPSAPPLPTTATKVAPPTPLVSTVRSPVAATPPPPRTPGASGPKGWATIPMVQRRAPGSATRSTPALASPNTSPRAPTAVAPTHAAVATSPPLTKPTPSPSGAMGASAPSPIPATRRVPIVSTRSPATATGARAMPTPPPSTLHRPTSATRPASGGVGRPGVPAVTNKSAATLMSAGGPVPVMAIQPLVQRHGGGASRSASTGPAPAKGMAHPPSSSTNRAASTSAVHRYLLRGSAAAPVKGGGAGEGATPIDHPATAVGAGHDATSTVGAEGVRLQALVAALSPMVITKPGLTATVVGGDPGASDAYTL